MTEIELTDAQRRRSRPADMFRRPPRYTRHVPCAEAVMASVSTFSESEAVVLGRLIGPERENLPVATARALLKLDFEPRDHERTCRSYL